MESGSFADDDFDDLPLDELDAVDFQGRLRVAGDNRQGSASVSEAAHVPLLSTGSSGSTTRKRDHQGCAKEAPQSSTSSPFSPPVPVLVPPPRSVSVSANEGDLMDEDMDCFLEEEEEVQWGTSSASRKPDGDSSRGAGASNSLANQDPGALSPTLTLTSPPFTYLRLLEEARSAPGFVSAEVRLKAFIMTLLGKLSSCGGSWSVGATISDGTGYMDVELSDGVLTGLLGFSVAEKEVMKREPSRRAELSAGMRRCQEELVDMCCVMTVLVRGGGGGKAVVTKAEPVGQKTLLELEQRVRGRREQQRR